MYHGISLYPFDTDENDADELQLNESIRVRFGACSTDVATDTSDRTSFRLLSSAPNAT